MKIIKRILLGLLLLIALGLTALGITIGYHSECQDIPSIKTSPQSMTAARYTCYGDSSVIQLREIERPIAKTDEILVRVKAAGVNPLDWHYMRGSPYLMRLMTGIGAPKDTRLGADFAGVVEAAGSEVSLFKPGDEVFGRGDGVYADFIVIRAESAVTKMPANVNFEEAASIPVAGITALQALRDAGELKPGQHVLINGASGGVGTFAVQIAKSMGAEVSGVCSTRNVAMVLSLGADRVIDYKKMNFVEEDISYDLIVDAVGNHSLLDLAKRIKPGGKLIMVGGPKGNWIAPLVRPLSSFVVNPFVDADIQPFLARIRTKDLAHLATMMREGTLKPILDRSFPLEKIADAIDYSESGRARGKIIMTENAFGPS